MNKRREQFLALVLSAAILGNSACSTTERQFMIAGGGSLYGIAPGETVWLRYAENRDNQKVLIRTIDEKGITGDDEHGQPLVANWADLYEVGERQSPAAQDRSRSAASTAAESVAYAIGAAALGAFAVAVCVGGTMAGNPGCLEMIADR